MKVKFQLFELDYDRQELLADGKPVSMPPKAFALLTYLVEHRKRMVSKRELLDEFWSTNISEAALLKTISLIRKAFNKVNSDVAFVKTYHGLGYRFLAEVEIMPESGDPTDNLQMAKSVMLNEQHFVSVLSVHFPDIGKEADRDDSDSQALESYLTTARSIVEIHQGNLLHMMPDGFTSVFGLYQYDEDTVRRAASCAAELAQIVIHSGLNKVKLSSSMGIDSGSVTLAKGGDNPQWMPPNSIERGSTELAKKAGSGEVLLSETSYRQLYDEAETEPVDNCFRLISPPSQRAGIPGRPLKRPSRFVGRTAEMAFLTTQLDALVAGHGQTVMLKGPAGIGKSRLVSEVLAKLDSDCIQYLKINCLPGFNNMPLAPMRDLCLAMLADRPQPVCTDDIDKVLLRELQGLDTQGESALLGLSDYQHRQQSYRLILRLLHEISDEMPLLIVFEDVHWTDTTSQEYLDEIIRCLDNYRVMLLLTSRPSESLPLIDTVLQLSPLGQSDSLDLLRASPENGNLSNEVAGTLIKRASGNPFFLEELALAAQAGANPATELPDSIQAVLAVRIRALEPELRNFLYIISAIGPSAPPVLITHLSGQSSADMTESLKWLIKTGFIVQDQGGYSFRHMLIHDTAYAMIARQDRIALHGRIARYFDNQSLAETERPETLAWHYQEAGETNQAILYWIAASRAAMHRSVHHEAVSFARQGLALINTDNTDQQLHELNLHLCQAPALTTLRGFGDRQVGEAYYRAQTLSQLVGTAKTRIRILVGLWIHTWVRGQLAESLSHANKLMELATDSNKSALKLQAYASKGEVLLHLGQTQNAFDYLKAGLAFISNAPPGTLPEQNAAVACAAYAAWASSLMGESVQADGFYKLSRQLQQTFNNPFAEAIYYALCSEYFMFEGKVDKCLTLADRAVKVSRQHNFPFWLGTGLVMRGWALGQQGGLDDGLTALQEGITVFEATGAGVQLANWYGLKAETLLAAKHYQAGLEAIEHALQYAEQAEDVFFVPRIHAIAAGLHKRLGNMGRYLWHSEQARSLALQFAIAPRNIVIPG